MKYIQKRLISDIELLEYSDRYYDIILVELDLDFLKERDVYGFYDGHGKMIAGYTINNIPPFRILNLIPKERCEGKKFCEAYEGQFSELIAMWKASRSKLFHSLFYLQVMATLQRSKSQWLLGAAVKRHAHDLYLKFLPHVIYEGEPDLDFQNAGGTGRERQVWVQYGNIKRMGHVFSVEGAKFLSQQFCGKILPRVVTRGKYPIIGKTLYDVFALAFYPIARVVFLLVKVFGHIQSRFEGKREVRG